MNARKIGLSVLALFVAVFSLPAFAQENLVVTMDQVNNVAHKLYCPVCPNETLEACQTQACAQWRAEIRSQLEQGQTEQEVINSFVRRFGERVLGTPQDPAMRALALATPFVIAGIALTVGVWTLTRWRRPQAAVSAVPAASADPYRDQLERDLRES